MSVTTEFLIFLIAVPCGFSVTILTLCHVCEKFIFRPYDTARDHFNAEWF